MDFFGIGSAMKGLLATYFRHARQTGRTTQLIDSLRDGDMVIIGAHNHGEKIRRECKERGIKIITKVVDPRRIHLDFGAVTGRCFFDHVWVEQYYTMAIEDAGKTINELTRKLSCAPMPESPMMSRNENLWRMQ